MNAWLARIALISLSLPSAFAVAEDAKSTPAGPTAPTGAPQKPGVFEWILGTWDDVRTSPADGDALARQRLAKCFHCHSPSNTRKAPPIPFDNDAKLLAWLEADHTYQGAELTGRELVLKLVWEEQHMPKAIIPFHERKAFKKFIKNLGTDKKADPR